MHKSYAIQDGCHNCFHRARRLDLVEPKDVGMLCGHEPETKTAEDDTRKRIVLYAEVQPAGKCGEWRGIV